MLLVERLTRLISAADGQDSSRIRLRTLVKIRWVAIAAQATAILTVHLIFGFDLPFGLAMGVVAASAALNLWASGRRPAAGWLGEREAWLFLVYDQVQLILLLYLTGGLGNPFAVLILAPVTVSATALSRRSTIGLAALTLVLATAVAYWHLPLPWHAPGFALPKPLVLGVWAALSVSVVFVAAYLSSIAEEARRMSDALAATQLALAREQRLSALGGLAAAAAHQLGSPLGTIAVVARDLSRELEPESPIAEDVALLEAETQRCRDILAQLAARPDPDPGDPFHRMPLRVLVETAAEPYRTTRVALRVAAAPDAAARDDEPEVLRSPEALHGLGNLIQNAVQFARTRVDIALTWDQETVRVTIADDGPGFAPGILEHLGDPYVAGVGDRRRRPHTRSQDDEDEDVHMGLGIFIARTLLMRTGARLQFGNRRGGGAQVDVTWPRVRIALPPKAAAPAGGSP
jgi:two-component system sensor histidine kinase RegB